MGKKKSFLEKNVLDQFDSQDILAIVFVIGGFILMFFRIDTIVGGLLTLIAGYYFGRKANQ